MQGTTGPATAAAATAPPPAVAEATVAVAHLLHDSVAIAGMSMHSCKLQASTKPAFGSFLDPTDRHIVDPAEVPWF